jgi:membrane-associated HD superfamily phosphohydrolase
MQSVFGGSLSPGGIILAVALVLMLSGAVGMWMQSEKTRADAVASGALLVFMPTIALQSLGGEAIGEWASLTLGLTAAACALALCWAVFVEGLSHDAEREQQAVERIEASIDAANTNEEDHDP